MIILMAIEVLFSALNQLIEQLIAVLPKLIIALIIWYVGKYILSFTTSILKRFDLNKNTELDDSAMENIAVIINTVGRVILVMIILDYLGIGSSIITAVAQGVTFAVAIALGLAFGKALEEDAKKVVDFIRNFLHK